MISHGFRKRPCPLLLCLLLLSAATGSASPRGMENTGYYAVTGPCNPVFPKDHGAHAGYRFEWWYYTGNVRNAEGKPYGFQLTLFRIQISPPGDENNWPENPSAWRTNQVFMAHAALSDLSGGGFYYDERISRDAVGLAGVVQEGQTIRAFLGTWSVERGLEAHRLRADSADFSLDILCRPLKQPVFHGKEGYSRKGTKPQDASCYYSFTRLNTSGRIMFRKRSLSVRGTAWMDHEFASAPLEEGILGWDWFSMQLDDGRDLMIYLLRLREGGYSTASSGTLVRASGEWLHLRKEDFRVNVLTRWKSPSTGALYPSRWQIEVFPEDMKLLVRSNLANQELITRKTAPVIYWEGSVSVSGEAGGSPVQGAGYVEMTGYARPFDLLK